MIQGTNTSLVAASCHTDSRSSRSVRRVVGVKSTLLREAINSFTAGMSLFDISCGTVRKEAIAAEQGPEQIRQAEARGRPAAQILIQRSVHYMG